ncbi:uncharacterized protein LOC121263076 [Juglans microcarpa x Juglans regia]|uniref:uncharacterized protein LOC121263076 n=1 Tax=Juglans microcarpa x Juglans regia TaxID=2249226 RepID=UPI001B7F4FEA|nr:uncharacterized protein LOC121263076 [Juglans microcarpa x Juglans regia]
MMQRSEDAPLDEFTADEIEAADILFHLPQLFFESESCLRFPSWGARRKRSLGVPIQSFLCFGLVLSPDSPSSEFRRETEVGAVVPKCQKKGQPAVKAEASSPATPLAFMRSSESEEKPEQSLKRKVLRPKRKREDWLEIIDELTQHRDSLNEERKYLRLHCTHLRASNLEMKAKLSLGPISKTVDSLGTENQDKDRTVRMHSTLSSSRGLGLVNNNVDPSPLPDLNLSLEETFAIDSSGPFDLNPINGKFSRVVAAQARQRRMQIYRAKKLRCR